MEGVSGAVHVFLTPMREALHFFWGLGRIFSLRVFEERRHHYGGVGDMLIDHSVKQFRIPRTSHCPYLVQIVGDEVWTKHKKALAGLENEE